MIARIIARLHAISFAWSCLQAQLYAYQEMRYAVPTPIYLSDDATEEELQDTAAEQRENASAKREERQQLALDVLL